jgi:hypothetical protein
VVTLNRTWATSPPTVIVNIEQLIDDAVNRRMREANTDYLFRRIVIQSADDL